MAGVEIIGHRGSIRAGGPPENTLAAVEAALADGADGVEVDVRLTADGVAVCVHDADLRRVAWSGRQVGGSTYQRLQAIRLPGNNSVPTLREVAASVRGRGLLVLDLKNAGGAAEPLAAAVVDVVSAAGTGADVVVSSFSRRVLDAVRRASPELRRALITSSDVPAVIALRRVLAGHHHDLHCDVRAVLEDHGIVERAAKHGCAVRAWTVSRPVDARLLEVAGVRSILADDPGSLRRSLLAASAAGVAR